MLILHSTSLSLIPLLHSDVLSVCSATLSKQAPSLYSDLTFLIMYHASLSLMIVMLPTECYNAIQAPQLPEKSRIIHSFPSVFVLLSFGLTVSLVLPLLHKQARNTRPTTMLSISSILFVPCLLVAF